MTKTNTLKTTHTGSAGFSLAECLLSVAITATALLAVIGMLIGALGEARDSRTMTVSGMLVRQLAGEARELMQEANSPREVIVLVDSALQVIGHSRSIGDSVGSDYKSGTANPSAFSFARLQRNDDPTNPLLERIMITVETPASAPVDQRKVFHYATVASK